MREAIILSSLASTLDRIGKLMQGQTEQAQTEQEREVAELIVATLNLEDTDASELAPEDPLFGDGLGLDSIDALELALAISQKYSVRLKADDKNMQQAFATLRSLSKYIEENAA
jgi:acyl carrier protein